MTVKDDENTCMASVYIPWKSTSATLFCGVMFFQNPARFNVMTQLRPWNDPDRKDQKRHRDRQPSVTLIYFYANNLPQIKLRKLPTDDSG